MSKQLLIGGLCLFLACSSGRSGATSYYVDGSNPSASDNNPGTRDLPWATLAKAARAMFAGDTAFVMGGTYQVSRSGNERYLPALNPAHDGAPGKPIVFQAYPGQTVVIQYAPNVIGRGPLIGSYTKDFIVWDGFTVLETDRNNQQDTGPVVIFGEPYDRAMNVTIRNCEVIGVPATVTPNYENHNAVRIEQADNAVVEDNRIHGTRGEFHNHAAIMMYFDNTAMIQNNDIYDCYTGIYVKGGNNTNITLRYNRIHGTSLAIRTSYTLNSAAYQNLIYDGVAFGGSLAAEPTKGMEYGEATTNFDFYNNTIVNVARGVNIPINQGQAGNHLRSNVFSTVRSPIYNESNVAALINSDYNVFSGFTVFDLGYVDRTLGQWQNLGYDANSLVADPEFGDDFHLNDTSPARLAGVDWGDLNADGRTTERINAGAYVTGSETIGTGGTPYHQPEQGSSAAGTAGASVHATPNPAGDSVRFTFQIPGSSPLDVRLRLFDLTGRWIVDLCQATLPPGVHSIDWARRSRLGDRVAPGYYEAIGTVGAFRVEERIVLLP